MMCYFPRENSLYTLDDERPPDSGETNFPPEMVSCTVQKY